MMKIHEYRTEIATLLNQMSQDKDVSYEDVLSYITCLTEECLANIDRMAGKVAPMIKEIIGVNNQP